jgi:hypothetical protein
MNPKEIQHQLDELKKDPRTSMSRLPPKRDAKGQILTNPWTPFAPEEIRGNKFVSNKDDLRRTFHTVIDGVTVSLDEVLPGRAPIEGMDRAENLVDKLQYVKPADMDAARLRKAALAETPWSDDYWPTYLGMLGRRYADPGFPAARDWKRNFDYIQDHPARDIVREGNASAIDRLSPSEKYDLLVGDDRGTLTSGMWSEGKWYHDRHGDVETWMGLCHGWAPAAYMLPRPRRVVTVKAADGRTDIRFYPSDIKALATLLWANARTASRFIGSRSSDKEPKTDEVGRVISPEVFDTNPGTWHMSVVNQIGVTKRSFILDATYDYEVWNQPVVGYEYSYFNPQRMEWTSDLQNATVPRAQFTSDRFKRYRSPSFAAAVGVAMKTTYVVETPPSHRASDDPSQDAVTSVDYLYDLELDASGKILGGEWYQNAHPDFLWTPPPGARALTPGEQHATGSLHPPGPVPVSWRLAAARTSAQKMPLAKIVERLIQLAAA